MKDNTTQKLVLAIAVLAAISFAVWAGLSTSVETPVSTAVPHGAFTTPF
jgi:hypothetical protein